MSALPSSPTISGPPTSGPSLPAWAIEAWHRAQTGTTNYLDLLRAEPERLMLQCGYQPDPWQVEFLRSEARTIGCCWSRQTGKSSVAAAMAILTAVLESPALVLLVSKSLRQSSELMRKVKEMYRRISKPAKSVRVFRPKPVKLIDEMELLPAPYRETVLTMELDNGSRIVCLPGSADTIACYSAAALIVIDEASRVPDILYRTVRPMLATCGGRLVLISTPFGKRGFFFEVMHGLTPDGRRNPEEWHRIRIKGLQCPRIPKEFLEDERYSMGLAWYKQEYECSFEDMEGSLFRHEDIARSVNPQLKPLYGEEVHV